MFSPYRPPLPGQKSVTRNKIKEVFYITDLDNLTSIMNVGIQSRNRAIQMKVLRSENDISDPSVQSLRENKNIRSPHDNRIRPLHDYVNFYPQPFNAMMAVVKLSKQDRSLCALRISSDILNIPGTLITNMNAACSEAKVFKPSEWTLPPEEFEAIRSLYLSGSEHDEDEATLKAFKRARQFEVLVLDFVLPRYINGVFVPNEQTKQRLETLIGSVLPIEINASLFLSDSISRQLQFFTPAPKRLCEESTNAYALMVSGQAHKKARLTV